MPMGHFVADNVIIQTLNGSNTFHGMGIILASSSSDIKTGRVRRLDIFLKVS